MTRSVLPQPQERRPLGTRGLLVSPFCIGMVADAGTVSAAFDLGMNFFFLTADLHWPSYAPLRDGLGMLFSRGSAVRDQVVVAVVSYMAQPEFCSSAFTEAFASVPNLARIDATIMGGAYTQDFFGRLETYEGHRRGAIDGVRAIGASFHDRRATALALQHGLVDVGFVRYNPAHDGAERDLFPRVAGRQGPLLYGFKSTNGFVSKKRCAALGLPPDKWRPEVVDYYRFALTRAELDGVLCAPGTPAQVQGIAEAMAKGPLDEDECTYLKDLALLGAGKASLLPDGAGEPGDPA
jgi:hypothetical protein